MPPDFPTGPGVTPPFNPNSDPNQQQGGLMQILQMLSKSLPQGAMGGMSPRGGGGPSIFGGRQGLSLPAPAVPNILGGGGPGGGGMPGGLPGRMAAPMGPASPNQPQSQGPPESGLYKSGFEFDSPKGRDAAVVTSAIQGVSQFLSQAKQKKEQKTKATAENYMSQIMAAQQSGDQETLNLLLQDPKVISTLEKGLNYLMPKVPGEPPPPEATGVKSALDKHVARAGGGSGGGRLPAPNTPGGVAFPRAPQSQANAQALQDLLSKTALQAMQGDPTMARKQALGTTLTGSESRQAEQWAVGMGISPAQMAQMNMEDKKLGQTFSMFKTENETELKKLAQQASLEREKMGSEEKIAQIHAGPMYERAKIAKEVSEATVKYREAMTQGKQSKANDIAMKTLTSQITNLRTLEQKATKDGEDKLATEYKTQADKLQKDYDEVKSAQEIDVDKIIKGILGPE